MSWAAAEEEAEVVTLALNFAQEEVVAGRSFIMPAKMSLCSRTPYPSATGEVVATECLVVSAHRAASAIPQMWYRQAEAVAQTVALGHLADGAEVRAETPVVLYGWGVRELLQGEAAAAPEALAWMVLTMVHPLGAEEVMGVSAFNSTFRAPRYTMEAEAVVGQIGE